MAISSALIDCAELTISGVQRVTFLRFLNSFEPPFRLDASLEKISKKCGVTKPQLSELFKMLINEGFLVSERNVNWHRGGRIYSSAEALERFWEKFVDTCSERPFELKAKELLGMASDTGFLSKASAKGGWGTDIRARLLAAILINRSDESGIVEKLTRGELLKLTGMTYAGVKKVLDRLIDAKLVLYVELNRSESHIMRGAETLGDATKARLVALKEASNRNLLDKIPNNDIRKPKGFRPVNITMYLNTGVLRPMGSQKRTIFFSTIASIELSFLIRDMCLLREKLLTGCSRMIGVIESRLASFNCPLCWPAIDLLACIDQEFKAFKLGLLKSVRWRAFKFLSALLREYKGGYRQLLLERPRAVVAKLRSELQSKLLGDRKGVLNQLLDHLALTELQELIEQVKYLCELMPAGQHLTYIQLLPGGEDTDYIKVYFGVSAGIVAPD